MDIDAPWLNSYGDVPVSLDYPDCSMAHLVLKTAETFPDAVAYNFFGCKQTYGGFADEIRLCARGIRALGIERGERVTICMPNTPQAVVMFYALNLVGAVANMVHPLSATEELARYLNDSRSVAAVTLDQFGDKLEEILPRTGVGTLVICGVEDGLRGAKKTLYKLTKGRKTTRRPSGGKLLRYSDLLQRGQSFKADHDANSRGEDVAAILYSGGTSGVTKGILLTNLNFNALAMQTYASSECVVPEHKMLAIMPIFHGFGLGVCIHTAYISGASTILVPQFSISSYAKLLKKHKPHYIAGVPTLFEALLRLRNIDKLDVSQLEGVFCGGDSLSVELKRKVDAFLREHGASVQVREGYGLTECVTASCLTPRDFHKEGSIGIPYPDTYYKIVRQGTQETLPYGEEGEIVLSGPTVMKSYDGNDEETAQALQAHPDGRVWLHTGDLGKMDDGGFVYFRQRIKRMIISSGYSVYPSQLENIIESHESVLLSCVIGIPDDYKMKRIKAFVVLRDGISPTEEIKASILEHCRRNIAKYAMPREFEYRSDLPRTLVGKVAYIELEKEEFQRYKQ
ncbi:MAG: AMP-binding protein [Oscillospiraceae bacterium]|jgi:long-chain acyl-CoA synthetase|nr:AMP-binding protein [Oscillospiraceae bacterium]